MSKFNILFEQIINQLNIPNELYHATFSRSLKNIKKKRFR